MTGRAIQSGSCTQVRSGIDKSRTVGLRTHLVGSTCIPSRSAWLTQLISLSLARCVSPYLSRIVSALPLPIKLDHYFPEMCAAFHVTKSFSGLRKRKDLIHHRMNLILFQGSIHRLKHFPAADIDSVHIQSLRNDREDFGTRFSSGQNSDQSDISVGPTGAY